MKGSIFHCSSYKSSLYFSHYILMYVKLFLFTVPAFCFYNFNMFLYSNLTSLASRIIIFFCMVWIGSDLTELVVISTYTVENYYRSHSSILHAAAIVAEWTVQSAPNRAKWLGHSRYRIGTAVPIGRAYLQW